MNKGLPPFYVVTTRKQPVPRGVGATVLLWSFLYLADVDLKSGFWAILVEEVVKLYTAIRPQSPGGWKSLATRRRTREPADELEQKLAAGLIKGRIAESIQDDEVHPGQMLGEPPLPSIAGLDLEAVDEVDHILEAPAGTGSNAAPAICRYVRNTLLSWAPTPWIWSLSSPSQDRHPAEIRSGKAIKYLPR